MLTTGFALLDDNDVDLEITHWSLAQLKDFCTLNGVNATGCETRDDYIDAIEKAFQDKEPPAKGGVE